MNDAKQPGSGGVAGEAPRLEDRLVELDAELGQLRQAVADLSAQNMDLNSQLDRLISSCERLVAGGGSDGEPIRRAGGLQRTASLMERAARKAVRGTVGVARRLTGS
ncbi:MAG: hypothetical protein V2I67_12445, partial [Thermoanaerobaculales bacterium]|nr:hypothetical protein [Thermoanaerobaculales bacterium]